MSDIVKKLNESGCKDIGNTKQWVRNCPNCNREVFHVRAPSRDQALKIGTFCGSCAKMVYHVTKLVRKCPGCLQTIKYNSKQVYLRALKENRKCKICGSKCGSHARRMSLNDFIKGARKVHGEKYNYSISNYQGYNKKLSILCLGCDNVCRQTPHNHLDGKGCFICAHKQIGYSKRSSTDDFIENAVRIHDDAYDYSSVAYKTTIDTVSIICKIHGEFSQRPNDHLSGKGCPHCHHQTSLLEAAFLNYIGIDKHHRNVYLKPYKVDGIDKFTNTIYEFLGDYWHGNPIKFNANEINPSNKKNYGELYTDTLKKLDTLKSMGYNVRYVWETDWNNFIGQKDNTLRILTH